MHAALAEAVAGRPVVIDPGILSTNDYVYAADIAAGVVLACRQPLRHQVYNLGSGQLATSEDVASAIRLAVPATRVDIRSEPEHGPLWLHEQRLDISRAEADLGYRPAFDLRRGIADFVDRLRRAGA